MNKYKFLGVFLSVMISVFAVAVITYATTIGNAVSVTTTLTVTGDTSLSTVTASGASTLAAVSATTGTFSSTLGVTGLSTLAGFISTASSTVNGRLNVQTSVGIATSTPSQELGVVGGGSFEEASGTTTLSVSSVGSGVGSCIQVRNTDGRMVRIYAGATTTSHQELIVETGSCQ